jgi:capsular polysaccharide transport system permease protein
MDGVRTDPALPARVSPRERSERIARSLTDAARRLRFSGTRAVYSPIGRRARRHRLISRLIVVGGFVAFVAVPTLLAGLYYGLVASDQYQAEARFAVRSGAQAGVDMLSSLTGVPSIQIIQDTQVVTNFIGSRAMVENLKAKAGFTEAYTTSEADRLSRLHPDEPIEEVVKYWQKRSHITIQMPGGTVMVQIRAFRPDDALRLTNAVVDASEGLVNELNERARQDAVRNSTNDLKFAADRLAKAGAALEIARNREGILDASGEQKKADALLTGLRQRVLELRQQYETMPKTISEDAPQMRTLRAAIAATEKQIVDLQAELTRSGGQLELRGTGTSPVLSASITRLSVLELELKVAEAQYASAATSLERARSASLQKQIYLTTFVRPALAEEGRFPRRLWSTFLVFLGGLALWGVVCGISVAIRGYF